MKEKREIWTNITTLIVELVIVVLGTDLDGSLGSLGMVSGLLGLQAW